jgi:GWxTD domain-containing protein
LQALKLNYLNIFLFILLIAACQSKKRQYTVKPTKSIINPDSDLLEVNAVAYHINDSVTTCYLQIINENLIYKRPDTTVAFYSELKVSYKLFTEQNSRKIIDSGSYSILDRANENVEIKDLVSKFNLKTKTNANYYTEIFVFDLNKKTKYSKYLIINKLDKFNDQNFLITINNKIAFKNNFLPSDNVNIKFNNPGIYKVTVDCFFKDFPTALPPFSSKEPDPLKYKPDSTFSLNISSNTISISIPQYGFYHIKTATNTIEGLTLFSYDKTFPGVSNIDEMIECTRYLMSKSEFEECKSAKDKKAVIDKFWLDIGSGSNERAKQLLKRYYGRVKEANKYYTSYTQGWKTDRGMIYVIFGEPTNIYKSSSREIWVYGIESNPAALRFTFNRSKNPFTTNDYILERSQFFKDPWYNAVDYWRQGNVYINNAK